MAHFPSVELHLRKMKDLSKAPGKAWQKLLHPLPWCPAYFTRRCYWKCLVAEVPHSFQGFSCALPWMAKFLYYNRAGAAQRFFIWTHDVGAWISSLGLKFHYVNSYWSSKNVIKMNLGKMKLVRDLLLLWVWIRPFLQQSCRCYLNVEWTKSTDHRHGDLLCFVAALIW